LPKAIRKPRLGFLADQNMVHPVARYLRGRGHRVVLAAESGLATEEDDPVIQYALANKLVVVTFDRDFRTNSLRAGCPCLWIQAPEVTARERLKAGYNAVIALLEANQPLVRIQPAGAVVADPGRQTARRPAKATKAQRSQRG
jgi:predicted nuclease of predicted toxin-antitoxin system